MYPQLEEFTFLTHPPTIHQVVRQLQHRLALPVSWQRLKAVGPLAMYQLRQAGNLADSVGLYQTNDRYVYLCCEQPYSALAQALMHTLISLGGVGEGPIPRRD